MGAWGPGIFDDDAACDVRDEFTDLIGEGRSPEDATAELERRWGEPRFDPDDEPVFWLALAAAQFRKGRLLPHVRDRAIALIDAGGDVDRYFDTKGARGKRAAALEKLKADLLGPQRKPTRIRRWTRHENTWPVGAILTYRLRSGRLCLWRVVNHHVDKGGRYPVIEVLRGTYVAPPSELRIALTSARRERRQNHQFKIILLPKHEMSENLAVTHRGGSTLARMARAFRRNPSIIPGHSMTIIPAASSIDDVLLDNLNLT